jgi:hypothetical protein
MKNRVDLRRIDETYVKSYDPKDIQQAKEWRLPEQEP